MKRNYKIVPQWWFHVMLILVTALSMYTCEGFGRQLQLPWWGLLLAMAMAFAFTLPIGVITATTNQVYTDAYKCNYASNSYNLIKDLKSLLLS
jgi:OPT oligopeptide transporter protein